MPVFIGWWPSLATSSPTTDWPIGCWWAELTHRYWVFTEAGYDRRGAGSGARGPLSRFLWDAPERISGEQLHEDGFLVAGRPEVLPEAPAIPLAAYCAADHVLVSPTGELAGIVDRRLEDIGLARRVVPGLPPSFRPWPLSPHRARS